VLWVAFVVRIVPALVVSVLRWRSPAGRVWRPAATHEPIPRPGSGSGGDV